MALIGALFLVVALSAFFLVNFRFKIEEAMFVSMSIIIVILTLFGLFGAMQIGQYLLYSLSFFSLAASVYLLIAKKAKISFETVVSPGLVVTIISFIIYTIITKNNVLYLWDEASLYGTAAHYMDATNTLSFGGSVTVFTYFFTRFAGYTEHALFVSRWLFMWICVVLPLSTVKWDKWYMAAIYAVFAFGIITLIDPETQYLMDAPIGIVAGSSIAYLSVHRNKSRTSILTFACTITITLKDNIGLLMFAFMGLFFLSYYLIESLKADWKLSKKNYLNISIFLASIIATLLVREKILPFRLKKLVELGNSYLLILIIISVVIISLIILWFTLLHKIFKKYIIPKVRQNTKLLKTIKISLLSIIPFALFSVIYKVIWEIMYSLTIELQKTFIYVLNNYFAKKYFGLPLYAFALLILILSIFCALTTIKKKYRSSLIAQSISLVSIIYVYGLIMAILFITDYSAFFEKSATAGIERFIGSVVIMVCIYLIAVAFSSEYWIDNIKQYIAATVVSLLLITSVPPPGETMFALQTNANMIANKYYVRPTIREHAELIKANTPEYASILIIALNDDGVEINSHAWQYWMYYECVPRPKPGVLSSIYSEKNEDGWMSTHRLEELIKFYDYVYIANVNDEFYLKYVSLFEYAAKRKQSGVLFKHEADTLTTLKFICEYIS